MDLTWRRFEVDGVTYYWRGISAKRQRGRGRPFEPVEMIWIGAAPTEPASFAMEHPAGTVLTEQHAIEALRIYLANGGTFA